MSTPVTDFISYLRDASSIEEERTIIANEMANMRTLSKEAVSNQRPNIVAKLIFLNSIGENVSWGQIEAVSLMSHSCLSHKRIGYLASSILLDEQSDLMVLATQTILSDLQSNNTLFQSLALSFIANVGTPELCQTVASEVEKRVASKNPNVAKRAAMAALRILRKVPDLISTFRPDIVKLLSSNKHSVVIAAIHLACEMIKIDPNLKHKWKHFAKPFTKLLRVMSLSKPTAEHRFSIFNDPFLQIRAMKLLGLLQQPSDELDEVLTSVVTAVDIKRNTGRSILFQTVDTISLSSKKPTLISLAFNQIGRLFNIREPNVIYSALSVFSQVLYSDQDFINRSSTTTLALQRYKSQIVHCLDHRDYSIRRRALDVILALVDKSNVETLIPEIIEYLHTADSDFRTEMVSKIYSSVIRFGPNPTWDFDIIHLLFINNDDYITNDILTSFCVMVAKNKSLLNHALPLLTNTMYGYPTNQTLVNLASYLIGEFETSDKSSIETMIKILKNPQTKIETKCYLITSLTKLCTRFNQIDEIEPLFQELSKDINIEIQQRAGEMLNILHKRELWDEMLLPPEFESNEEEQQQQQQSPEIIQQEEDLLSLSSIPNNNNNTNNNNNNLVDDLLDITSLTPETVPKVNLQNDNNANVNIKVPENAIEVLKTSDIVMYFEVQKNSQNVNQIAIRVTLYNLSNIKITKFNIQYGVPNGWQLMVQQQNNDVLEPCGNSYIQQILMLARNGDAELVMKTKMSYMFGCQPVTTNNTLNKIL
ncbi:Adaptin N terminal region family protein [Histomonas meleagridis]|uniref:Adaptin N terminal region family protein n=1 Tax=Histomonas meleagridis TaxID=135588 RepID=UPI00355A9099|nr:Adaptin N terminal region family protein [Histomonas meleagridis]KAH0803611.1 Adaptin N terminal region family protein [Histomonas meleagridis]